MSTPSLRFSPECIHQTRTGISCIRADVQSVLLKHSLKILSSMLPYALNDDKCGILMSSDTDGSLLLHRYTTLYTEFIVRWPLLLLQQLVHWLLGHFTLTGSYSYQKTSQVSAELPKANRTSKEQVRSCLGLKCARCSERPSCKGPSIVL
jgi:hypothetical protein